MRNPPGSQVSGVCVCVSVSMSSRSWSEYGKRIGLVREIVERGCDDDGIDIRCAIFALLRSLLPSRVT